MARTGLITHPDCLKHLTGPGHPERPARLEAVHERLAASGLASELESVEASPAPLDALERVHGGAYLERARAFCDAGGGPLDSEDTVTSSGTWPATLLAAGGALEAVDRVVDGTWSNAFVACRPPGHHAERDLAMGFCLVNHAAVAAAHLRAARGLKRVAILDWDVHHGNGTQHAFEDDPTVFYASLHQWPLYPGTGAASERGRGAGEGATRNCPMPSGSGPMQWLGALEDTVLPELEAFRPELVLISAGFDAHRDDPLAQTRLEDETYGAMTRSVVELARRTCGGRVVALLEGGYDLEALGRCVEVHVGELADASRADG